MPPMADAAAYLPRRFRFVVFDWDGTLADSTTIIAEALQQACRDIGAAVPDDVDARYVIGLGLADALRHVAPDLPPARHPDLVARYRHHYLAREAAISLFAGVREMLSELGAAGTVLGVVFCLRLSRLCLRLETLPQRPHLGLPAIPAFLHLGQTQFQALVLAFGRLALLLPLIPASLEEVDQLGKRTEKRKRATGWHQITSM